CFLSKRANGPGDFFLEGATRARLQCHGNEARQDFEGGGKRGGGGLRAKHGRQGIGGAAAGAGGDDIVDGLVQRFVVALKAFQVIAKRPGYGLFNRIGFGCHADFGAFCPGFSYLSLGSGRGSASTVGGAGWPQGVLNPTSKPKSGPVRGGASRRPPL